MEYLVSAASKRTSRLLYEYMAALPKMGLVIYDDRSREAPPRNRSLCKSTSLTVNPRLKLIGYEGSAGTIGGGISTERLINYKLKEKPQSYRSRSFPFCPGRVYGHETQRPNDRKVYWPSELEPNQNKRSQGFMGWVDSLLRRLYLGIQIGRASIYSRGNKKMQVATAKTP